MIVDAFVEARLLTSTHTAAIPDEQGISAKSTSVDEPTVEVAHEALLRQWPPLREAIEADRAGLRLRSDLERLTADWQQGHLDESYLLHGGRLATINEWANQHPNKVGPVEREYLEASQDRAARELTRLHEEQLAAEESAAPPAWPTALTATCGQQDASLLVLPERPRPGSARRRLLRHCARPGRHGSRHYRRRQRARPRRSRAPSALLRVAWRALVLAGVDEPQLLPKLQQVLVSERHDRSLSTTVCTVAIDEARDGDTPTALIRLAGHPPPIVLADVPHTIAPQIGPPLGMEPGARWDTRTVSLGDARALLLYTPGLIKGSGTNAGMVLGTDGLIDLLADERCTDLDHLSERLLERAEQLNGGPLVDDVATLLLSLDDGPGAAVLTEPQECP